MNEFAHIRIFGYHLQRGVAHVFRVRCGEPNAHRRHGFGYRFEQCRKIDNGAIGRFEMVRIDILPEQRYLFVAACFEVAHFAQNALYVATALASARVGHDAVRAKIVAAAHNADKSRNGITQTAWQHVAIGFGGGQLHVHGTFTA